MRRAWRTASEVVAVEVEVEGEVGQSCVKDKSHKMEGPGQVAQGADRDAIPPAASGLSPPEYKVRVFFSITSRVSRLGISRPPTWRAWALLARPVPFFASATSDSRSSMLQVAAISRYTFPPHPSMGEWPLRRARLDVCAV